MSTDLIKSRWSHTRRDTHSFAVPREDDSVWVQLRSKGVFLISSKYTVYGTDSVSLGVET